MSVIRKLAAVCGWASILFFLAGLAGLYLLPPDLKPVSVAMLVPTFGALGLWVVFRFLGWLIKGSELA